ncbi:universal stress protein [Leekyejoonella antrihumi]|uniref:Universal stress protein n=1 Tax=Leekyejoonella antrihumi TaxID=1660198 RepID=A0A563DTN7_9MICO|nr:universal stress protein [Leekyejoonella antrihumi]TWP33627.1 universal stress protein [Leekyejoonella antrihumi]
MSPNRIVVGVDGSAHSMAALRWALQHAESLGWQVRAVYSWQLPMISIPGAFDQAQMQQLAGTELVRNVAQVSPNPAVPLEMSTAQGDPTECLLAACADASMLVVGTRGRSAFRGLLLGAVSQGCAAAAPCPVVIINQHEGL